MDIRENISNDVAVLILSGKKTGGLDITRVYEHAKGLIARGLRKAVLDPDDVQRLNSSGMGTLIACMTPLKNAGGCLKLSSVGEKVESLLMMTHLHTIFDSWETVDRAVCGFSSGVTGQAGGKTS